MSMVAQSGLTGQIGRYAASGLVNTGLGLAVIFGLHLGAGLAIAPANAAGYAVGWTVSYVLNRSWVFGDGAPALRTAPAFLLLVLAAFAGNLAIIYGLKSAGLPYGPAQLAGTAFYSIAVFLGARHVVFTERD